MTKQPIIVNKKISNPQGALKVFQELDFERIQNLGLDSRVIFYIGIGILGENKITRIYQGTIHAEPNITGSITSYPSEKISLPFSHDIEYGANDFGKGNASFLGEISRPRDIEFIIEASNSLTYHGLNALRKVIIPKFFNKGYDKGNLEHTSIFWLHLTPHRKEFDEHILDVSSYGLDIHDTEVNGIKVFTQGDLDKFKNFSSD